MMAKVGLILIVVVSLAFGLFAYSSRAEDNCLVAPNARTPQGSHWYFHNDPIKQRKCWHLRTKDQATQGPVGGEKPVMPATRPQAAVDQAVPDARSPQPVEAAPAALGRTLAQGGTHDNGQADRQAEADPKTWPDPPSPAGTGRVVWPEPPSLTYRDTTESTQKEKANQKQEVPATADLSNDATGNGAGGSSHAVRPTKTKVARAFPVAVVLGLVGVLVIAGIFLSDVVRMYLARRRELHPDPRGPIFDEDSLDDEVKGALRKLSRIQSGQRKAASA